MRLLLILYWYGLMEWMNGKWSAPRGLHLATESADSHYSIGLNCENWYDWRRLRAWNKPDREHYYSNELQTLVDDDVRRCFPYCHPSYNILVYSTCERALSFTATNVMTRSARSNRKIPADQETWVQHQRSSLPYWCVKIRAALMWYRFYFRRSTRPWFQSAFGT